MIQELSGQRLSGARYGDGEYPKDVVEKYARFSGVESEAVRGRRKARPRREVLCHLASPRVDPGVKLAQS